jgi:Tfp pilus assembly protein PilF
MDPKDTVARLNMGVVLLQAGVYPRAEKELRAVLDVETDNDEAALGLAAALRGQGKRDSQGPFLEAEKILKGVLERDPHQFAAMLNLAVLYADYLGKPDKARPLVDQFLSEAPDKHPGRPVAEKLKADAGVAKPEGAAPAAPAKPKGKAPAGKPKAK